MTTPVSFANNATTTPSGTILVGDTSINVTSAAGFPSSGNYTILIDNELLLVTSGQGTTTWGVTRAQESTSAAQHTNTSTIYQVVTVAGINGLNNVYYSNFAPSGLTGATAASRYVGGTAAGAPTSGTFAQGDFEVSQDGRLMICTTAGTPGTWLSAASLITSTISGATNAVAGFSYQATGTFNVTLPAPFAGAVVEVINKGTGTVTVAQHAAETISGPNWSAVASIAISTTGGFLKVISDGTNWLVESYGPGPLGLVAAPATVTSAQNGITTTADITNATISFTALANRQYRIMAAVLVLKHTADIGNVNINRTVQSPGIIQTQSFNQADGAYASYICLTYDSPAGGSCGYKLSASANSGSIDIKSSSGQPLKFAVEDVGPATPGNI